MRKIVRKVYETKIQVLCLDESNQINPIGELVMDGEFDTVKAKRHLNKEYPDKNVFIGEHSTVEGVYSMDADEFMKHAKKEK